MGEAVACDNEDDLPKVVEKWLTHDGPMLIDFKVVPDICLPMVAPGKALDEMILLEDREDECAGEAVAKHAALRLCAPLGRIREEKVEPCPIDSQRGRTGPFLCRVASPGDVLQEWARPRESDPQ